MARGGKRPGAGRPRGTPNKATAEARVLVNRLLDKKLPELEAMIDETRYGIEIEKTTTATGPDGKPVAATVLGRLNADPGKAADLMLKLAEFCLPKLRSSEITGPDGGPVQVIIRKYGDAE